MKTKHKKKTKDKIIDALGDSDKKELTPTQMVAARLSFKHGRGSAKSASSFRNALRKLAKQHGYVLDMLDESNGMTIQITANYVGKTSVLMPEMAKLKL